MNRAIRLMQRFGVPESLIGDLVERRRTHSVLWFCRQVALAVLATGVHDIVEHTWFALRTLVTAWIVGFLFQMVVANALRWFWWNTDVGYALLIRPTGWFHLPELMVHCVLMLALGTALMRLTRRHRAAVLLLWTTSPLPFAALFAWNQIRYFNSGVAAAGAGSHRIGSGMAAILRLRSSSRFSSPCWSLFVAPHLWRRCASCSGDCGVASARRCSSEKHGDERSPLDGSVPGGSLDRRRYR